LSNLLEGPVLYSNARAYNQHMLEAAGNGRSRSVMYSAEERDTTRLSFYNAVLIPHEPVTSIREE
jgi:hypothetical protein